MLVFILKVKLWICFAHDTITYLSPVVIQITALYMVHTVRALPNNILVNLGRSQNLCQGGGTNNFQ